ncbi:MAG: hypothetical protein Q7T77_03845 [Sulfuricurvum sp.]|nr:hypothetical protein [Sulfuricurvum sp.]
MEEIFKNIKYHMENHYEKHMEGRDISFDVIVSVKNLYLSNLVKMLEVSAVYDADIFTSPEAYAEAGDYLESCYMDFKKMFPLVDFTKNSKLPNVHT